ncbi:hypothetical protein FKW77_005188 [Venturia effusa]|uniref:Uncharacterized protein n=1 Tax=Venturia effusa TaxID=50376 RepID=A0A517L1B5_9PEZI|nr:hypothetical protein FKW77_005188 [Venturia effusa]
MATTPTEPDEMSATHKVKEPASFHDLAREIRQKILLESFADAASKDLKFNKLVNSLCASLELKYMCKLAYAPQIMTWACTLRSTSAIIASDIAYVVELVLTDIELEFFKVRKENINPELQSNLLTIRWVELLCGCPFDDITFSSWTIEQIISSYKDYESFYAVWRLRFDESMRQMRKKNELIKATFGIGAGLQLASLREG